jgi:hypothetical protein
MKSFSTLVPRLFSPEAGRERCVLGLAADTLFFALLVPDLGPAQKELERQSLYAHIYIKMTRKGLDYCVRKKGMPFSGT